MVPLAISIEELTCGYTFRASTAALQKNGRKERFTPSRAAKSAFTRWRRAAIRVTSTSTTVVNCALVCSDSTMRSAITRRNRLIFSVRPRSADGSLGATVAAGTAGADSLAAGGAAALFLASTAARTSALRIRPPTPEPEMVARSMSLSAASLRTSGVTYAPDAAAAAGAGVTGAAGVAGAAGVEVTGAAGAGAAGAGVAGAAGAAGA